MSKYIDRIIEVDDNNVWKPIVLSHDEFGDPKESMVFGYSFDSIYDREDPVSLVCSSAVIPLASLGDATRAYIAGRNSQEQIYCVSLRTMLLQSESYIERSYAQLADSFHGHNYREIMKAIVDGKQPDGQCHQDEDSPRMEYDCIIEDLRKMFAEIYKIETIAKYVAGVTDPDKIRIVFFGNG